MKMSWTEDREIVFIYDFMREEPRAARRISLPKEWEAEMQTGDDPKKRERYAMLLKEGIVPIAVQPFGEDEGLVQVVASCLLPKGRVRELHNAYDQLEAAYGYFRAIGDLYDPPYKGCITRMDPDLATLKGLLIQTEGEIERCQTELKRLQVKRNGLIKVQDPAYIID